jgi:hypothetical protein
MNGEMTEYAKNVKKVGVGRPRTKSLFFDLRGKSEYQGNEYPYTLKEEDWRGSLSMYKIYMEEDTEYDAAIRLLGSWRLWETLCACTWFKPYKVKWDEERRIRDKSLAKNILMEEARNGSVTAAKIIYDEDKKKAGRPTKQEKNKVAREEAEVEEFLKASLKVIK